MIQLYVAPSLNGHHSIIRKLDGVYSLVPAHDTPNADIKYPLPRGYYADVPGISCNQAWAASVVKYPLLDPDGSAKNRLFYGIDRDAEIYRD